MPYLQVRDFPPELYQRLKQQAKSEHRSVSQQTIIAISEHIALASTRSIAGSPVMASLVSSPVADLAASHPTPSPVPNPMVGSPVPSPVAGSPVPNIALVGAEERIEKRKRLFARIKATPKPNGCPSSESIVELIRSERDSR
jgi:hypothetical protein